VKAAMGSLVEARGLQKVYFRRQGAFRPPVPIRAVDGVNLAIQTGEVFGLIGESGCGKSTTLRLLMGLEPLTDGIIRFDGHEAPPMGSPQWRALRCQMAMIFQDPYDSLNPGMRIGDIVGEPLALHMSDLPRTERRSRIRAALEAVELHPSAQMVERFPHELSGGQRQRVAIARALVLGPRFVAADEPTSMLDVSVRAGILNAMLKLKQDLGLTVLFVTHDLSVARYMCDRIGVMYNGTLVECGPVDEVTRHPAHPYTRALIRVVSSLEDFLANREAVIRSGEAGNVSQDAGGCRFAARCPFAVGRCREVVPEWREVSPSHMAACHFPESAT